MKCQSCHRYAVATIPLKSGRIPQCAEHYAQWCYTEGRKNWRDAMVDARIEQYDLMRRAGEPRSEWLTRIGKTVPEGAMKKMLRGLYKRSVAPKQPASSEAAPA